MNQYVLKTFQSKYFLIPVIIASVALAVIYIYYTSIKDLVIFPDKNAYQYDYYTDQANKGNSEVLEFAVSDSSLKLVYLLKDQFHSPYVGFSITPVDKKYINAEKYNAISLSISGHNTDRIGFALYTPPIELSDRKIEDQTLYHSYLNISSTTQTYNIPTKNLNHPEWWEDLHQLPEDQKVTIDLSKILHINIGSAFSPDIEQKKRLEIDYIAFSRNNRTLFLVTGLIYLAFVIICFVIPYFFIILKHRDAQVVVTYQSLDIAENNSSEEKCIAYINNHYNNSNLTLEKIAEETAITPRGITKIIHDKYNCNFKTYLNRIRINESKRLLTHTQLNIGEIAYKVGFNNQSHFNRVFKNEMDISPTAYREKYRY